MPEDKEFLVKPTDHLVVLIGGDDHKVYQVILDDVGKLAIMNVINMMHGGHIKCYENPIENIMITSGVVN